MGARDRVGKGLWYRSARLLSLAKLVPWNRFLSSLGSVMSSICNHVPTCSNQWGRRLEGWPNTAARLAGWRTVTRQVWFCTWWTGRTACLFRNVPVSLPGAAQLLAEETSSCCYIINVQNNPSWAPSRKEAWPGTLVVRCLLFGSNNYCELAHVCTHRTRIHCCTTRPLEKFLLYFPNPRFTHISCLDFLAKKSLKRIQNWSCPG
jgi:hypothetical protein